MKIMDVHLRFEDDQSDSSSVFACGFTVNSLTIQSSDQHWIPRYYIYLLFLTNFSCFWNK